jgi:hypothetical protein
MKFINIILSTLAASLVLAEPTSDTAVDPDSVSKLSKHAHETSGLALPLFKRFGFHPTGVTLKTIREAQKKRADIAAKKKARAERIAKWRANYFAQKRAKPIAKWRARMKRMRANRAIAAAKRKAKAAADMKKTADKKAADAKKAAATKKKAADKKEADAKKAADKAADAKKAAEAKALKMKKAAKSKKIEDKDCRGCSSSKFCIQTGGFSRERYSCRPSKLTTRNSRPRRCFRNKDCKSSNCKKGSGTLTRFCVA